MGDLSFHPGDLVRLVRTRQQWQKWQMTCGNWRWMRQQLHAVVETWTLCRKRLCWGHSSVMIDHHCNGIWPHTREISSWEVVDIVLEILIDIVIQIVFDYAIIVVLIIGIAFLCRPVWPTRTVNRSWACTCDVVWRIRRRNLHPLLPLLTGDRTASLALRPTSLLLILSILRMKWVFDRSRTHRYEWGLREGVLYEHPAVCQRQMGVVCLILISLVPTPGRSLWLKVGPKVARKLLDSI